MEKHSDGIRKSAEGLSDEISKGHNALAPLHRNAKSTLRALNIELHEEAIERRTPIALPAVRILGRSEHRSGDIRS
jgi:hypothetical protein